MIYDADDFKQAVYNNNITIIREYLETGGSIHVCPDAVVQAIKNVYGISDSLKLLLDYGANVHYNDDEAFLYAIKYINSYKDVIKLLLSYGADVHVYDEYALLNACNNSDYDSVKLFLQYGADVHYDDEKALRSACSNYNFLLIDLLVRYGAVVNSVKVIEQIIYTNNNTILEFLLTRGLDLHFNNDYALRYACSVSRLPMIKNILDVLIGKRFESNDMSSAIVHYMLTTNLHKKLSEAEKKELQTSFNMLNFTEAQQIISNIMLEV